MRAGAGPRRNSRRRRRYCRRYPCFEETTKTAIEAAWAFFGGVFHVLIPDNTKTIVNKADPLEPLINEAFLEYAQSRNFAVDPTRPRSPEDKGRVERAVQLRVATLLDGDRRESEHAR